MRSRIKSRMMGGRLGNILRIPKENPFPGIIGTFMGRDALSLAIRYLDLGSDDIVLLPAYLCHEVLKPFLGRTRIAFYDIQPDLTVDPEEIKLKLDRSKATVMIIINYFGFLQPYRKEIKKICMDRDVVLIEDCAHSLLSEGSGEIGDLLIYSFAKILPLPDGGGLKVRMDRGAVTASFYPRIYSDFLSVLIMLKPLFNVQNEIFSRAWLTSRKTGSISSPTSIKRDGRILRMSSFAYNGMGNVSFPEIIERRRNDYQFWQRCVERSGLPTPIFNNLAPGICPLGFPVKVKDRDMLKSRLQREGILLKIHWHLPGMVEKEFVNSYKLSMQTITLPIYPELDQKQREGIQRILAS